jgi:ATP-binding cassette, subfamily B, bacterial
VNSGPRATQRDSWGISLRSSTTGRQRWGVEGIIAKPYLAQPLQNALLKHPDVQHVKVNPTTGRVLVLFSHTAPRFSIGKLIKDSLDEIVARGVNPADQPEESAALHRILKTSLPDRRQLALPAFVSGLSFLVRFLEGLFIVNAIKTGGDQLSDGEATAKKPPSLMYVVGTGIVLNSLDVWLRYHRTRLWQKVGQETQQELRTQLIAQIENQDLVFFDQHSTGELMNLVTEDTQRIGEFVGRGGEQIIENALSVSVYGMLMLNASPTLALMAGVPMALLFLPSRLLGKTLSESYARRSEMSGKFSQMLENNLADIVDVKSFTAEEQEIRRFAACGQELSEASVGVGAISALESGIGRGIYSIGFALTSAYGGQLVDEGKLKQVDYLRVVYLFQRILNALGGLEEVTRLYHGAKTSSERIVQALDARPSITSGPVRITRNDVRGEVIFENVSFGYHPQVKVLENVSFQLRPGEKLGIVGRTGSGKSTLLRLLMRFYDVDQGRILLDGRDIRELDLKDLRSMVSLVSQEAYLFQGTVRDNVAYGKLAASETEVVDALAEAGAKELLTSVPGGLEAEVGERGRKLSGGQRQRIAIARALLKDAPVLALDEVTSHLDYETEASVKRSVREVTTEKSVITIAHRLAVVRDSDKIIVLDGGKIREEGNHEALVGKGGIYASLWQLQTGAGSHWE